MALIVYRMSTLSSKKIYEHVDPVSYRYLILLPVTTGKFKKEKNPFLSILQSISYHQTGIINLIVITILNYLYDYLAVFLTDLEYRRTQTEYDNSLSRKFCLDYCEICNSFIYNFFFAVKIYLFQFINYYSSLFYIAFLKGKWTGTPAK